MQQLIIQCCIDMLQTRLQCFRKQLSSGAEQCAGTRMQTQRGGLALRPMAPSTADLTAEA